MLYNLYTHIRTYTQMHIHILRCRYTSMTIHFNCHFYNCAVCVTKSNLSLHSVYSDTLRVTYPPLALVQNSFTLSCLVFLLFTIDQCVTFFKQRFGMVGIY